MVEVRLCRKCGEAPAKSTKTSNSWCRECCKAYERQRWSKMDHKVRATKALKRAYGIDFNDYEKLVIAQNYKCKTCNTDVETTPGPLKGVVDHCHTTGKIRGILCNHCNKALGLIYDNTNTLSNMIVYLNDR